MVYPMLFAFMFTVAGSIFLSILASSFLWKYKIHMWYGYITSLSMAVIGILMMLIFDQWKPEFLTLSQYVLVLYGLCLLYFILQLIFVMKWTKQRRLAHVNI
jgi:predicted membrane channel-forming protein YqfA (hemolysin III family)